MAGDAAKKLAIEAAPVALGGAKSPATRASLLHRGHEEEAVFPPPFPLFAAAAAVIARANRTPAAAAMAPASGGAPPPPLPFGAGPLTDLSARAPAHR